MDHLYWPKHFSKARPRVPYLLDGIEHTICNRLENIALWPDLMSWQLAHNQTLLEAAKISQGWLYFGLLRFLCLCGIDGKIFRLGTFVRKTGADQVSIVDSSLLPALLRSLQDYVSTPLLSPYGDGPVFFPFRLRKYWLRKVNARGHELLGILIPTMERYCLWIAGVLRTHADLHATEDIWSDGCFAACFATLLLFETVFNVVMSCVKPQDRAAMQADINFMRPFILTNPQMAKSFRALNICPSIIRRFSPTPMEAFQRLYLPSGDTKISHDGCGDKVCHATNVNVATYVPKHSELCNNSKCFMLYIDNRRLERLVQNDCIPIVASTTDVEGQLSIDLIDGRSTQDYVAISHVWSGGLGNFRENGHYRCQLLDIHRDIQHSMPVRHFYKKHDTVYYWLDTLCVPAGSGFLKTKAINSMATLYAGAAFTLVYDPYLSRARAHELSRQEVRHALDSSPWMARSWTLHEGALSVDARLVFRDCIWRYDDLLRNDKTLKSTSIQAMWKADVQNVFGTAFHGADDGFETPILALWEMPMKTNPHEQFVRVWNELAKRNSTMEDDLPAIMAAFLGHSAGEVLALPKQQRLLAMLRAQPVLPLAILFLRQEAGIAAWCPVFPSSKVSAEMHESLAFMKPTTDGAAFAVYDLSNIEMLVVTEKISVSKELRLHETRSQRCYSIHFFQSNNTENAGMYKNAMFLLCESRTPGSATDGLDGVCLKIDRDDEVGLHVRYLKRVSWKLSAKCEGRHGLHGTNNVESGHVFCTAPIHSELFSSERPLLLYLGSEIWPVLSWSRPSFYPFTDTSLRYAQLLAVFPWLATCSSILTASTTLALMKLCFDEGQPQLMITYVLGTVCFYIWRRWLARAELRYWKRQAHSRLQRIWAASFSTAEHIHKESGVLKIENVLKFGLLYGTLLLISITGIIWDLVDAYPFQSDIHSDIAAERAIMGHIEALFNVHKRSHPTALLWRHTCRCVCFELSSRLVVLIMADPFDIAAYLGWKEPRSSKASAAGSNTQRMRHQYSIQMVRIRQHISSIAGLCAAIYLAMWGSKLERLFAGVFIPITVTMYVNAIDTSHPQHWLSGRLWYIVASIVALLNILAIIAL